MGLLWESRSATCPEDVFTVLELVTRISVDRVIAITAVDFIQDTVSDANPVIAVATEHEVSSEAEVRSFYPVVALATVREVKTVASVYAVVTALAIQTVLATATIDIVGACPTTDRVPATKPIDPVLQKGACEGVVPKGTRNVCGQSHPTEQQNS
jgi:hypothetical protein